MGELAEDVAGRVAIPERREDVLHERVVDDVHVHGLGAAGPGRIIHEVRPHRLRAVSPSGRAALPRLADALSTGGPTGPAGPSPTAMARRTASAASSASPVDRAWTTARGRSGPTASPGTSHVRQADAGIDGVPGAAAAAAQRHHREADQPRVHPRDDPRALGRDGEPHGRRGEVPVRALEEIGGPAEGHDHAREALGRGARGERALDGAVGLAVVARRGHPGPASPARARS